MTATEINTTVQTSPASRSVGGAGNLANSETELLVRRLKQLQPWRMSIQITNQINTSEFLNFPGSQSEKFTRTRTGARERFLRIVDTLFPDGLVDRRFLDCGCNAGAYCFWARERKAEIGYGFDVREHWIKQARFIKNKRTIADTNRIQFEVFNVYDLPRKDLDPFDIVQFKGLFCQLSDPINGLKLAADLSRDILIFSSAFVWGATDGSLMSESCELDLLHGSVEKQNWIPTGPKVCAEIIRNLGFDELKLTKLKQVQNRPNRGRLEIIAAREKNRLLDLNGKEV